MPEPLRVTDGRLQWEGRSAPADDVTGFDERVSPWTGRGSLRIQGLGWEIPIDEHYGGVRAALREEFSELPFRSGWSDGRFPAAPFGLPEGLATVLGLVLAAGVVGMSGWRLGAEAAVAAALLTAWPVLRLRDRLVLRDAGLAAGPAWAALRPWHEVRAVRIDAGARRTRVQVLSRQGVHYATIPTLVLPALRARLWRQGGLPLAPVVGDLDDRYRGWQRPAAAVPWGVCLATIAIALVAPAPWRVLTAGLVAMLGLALLGAAVQSRATGWGAGAVLWLTGLYAVVMLAIGLGVLGF